MDGIEQPIDNDACHGTTTQTSPSIIPVVIKWGAVWVIGCACWFTMILSITRIDWPLPVLAFLTIGLLLIALCIYLLDYFFDETGIRLPTARTPRQLFTMSLLGMAWCVGMGYLVVGLAYLQEAGETISGPFVVFLYLTGILLVPVLIWGIRFTRSWVKRVLPLYSGLMLVTVTVNLFELYGHYVSYRDIGFGTTGQGIFFHDFPTFTLPIWLTRIVLLGVLLIISLRKQPNVATTVPADS